MRTIPVHVISGFLGAGKTTLLIRELARRADRERCAIVVNDFGEAELDGSLMAEHAPVRAIPGGCICCTAPEGLVPALEELIREEKPDRIFIETTGLARPADVVDTVARSGIAVLELQATVVVLDPERFVEDTSEVFLSQLAAADVLVANRSDTARPEALSAVQQWARDRYPPLEAVHICERGVLPEGALEKKRPKGFRVVAPVLKASTDGWFVESRSWDRERVFDMGRIKSIAREARIERFKGLFRTDIGWYCIQVAGGQLEAVPTGIRSGSRVDAIADDRMLLQKVVQELDEAVAPDVDPKALSTLLIGLAEEEGVRLSRADLLGLDGQVPDVSVIVPGREGSGVWLSSVLRGSGAAMEQRFVVVAGDGMTSAPAAVGEAGEAVLVHSLDGGAYPREKGGPFRIFVPPGEGRSACSNVKQVVRISIDK